MEDTRKLILESIEMAKKNRAAVPQFYPGSTIDNWEFLDKSIKILEGNLIRLSENEKKLAQL
jgi:hypothetical protein